jgi:hypothetical protein
MLASQQQSAQPTIITNNTYNSSTGSAKYEEVMSRLADRLNEPFVTVNTVTGDKGINQAQEEYNRLIRNKSPKARK